MATDKNTKVRAAVETKKAAPRRKPAAAAAMKPAMDAAPKTRKSTPRAQALAVTPGEIERLAYQLWEERGRPEGSSTEDWTRAQEILMQAR